MKSLLTLFILLSSIFVLNAQNQTNYYNWFADKGLRIDFYHEGNFEDEIVIFKEYKTESFWGGNIINLIDSHDYGAYRVIVYDSISEEQIFSYGFSNLFSEWQTTSEAIENTKIFEGVISIPMPLNASRIDLHRRDRQNNNNLLHSFHFNPSQSVFYDSIPPISFVETIHNGNFSGKKLEIAFIAEGYDKDESNLFLIQAKALKDYLLSVEPFKSEAENITIHAIASISEDSGVSNPMTNSNKNTALRSHFGTFNNPRYLTSPAIFALRDYSSLVPCNQVCILVNTNEYGGGGIYNFYAIIGANHPLAGEVLAHELGHSLADLGDEYYTDDVTYIDFYDKTVEPYVANLTTLVDFESKFWHEMMDKNTPIPTPVLSKYIDKLGVYEGGGYSPTGIYRPFIDCKMKALFYDFCPVCNYAIKQMIDFYSDK